MQNNITIILGDMIANARAQILSGNHIDLYSFVLSMDEACSALNAQQKRDIAMLFDVKPADVTQVIKQALKNTKVIKKLGSVPSNEYEYINSFMNYVDAEFNFAMSVYDIKTPYEVNGSTLPVDMLHTLGDEKMIAYLRVSQPKQLTAATMRAELLRMNAELKLGYASNQIDSALEYWTTKTVDEQKGQIVAKIAYNKQAGKSRNKLFKRFSALITDQNSAAVEIMMQHWVWQVKRKIFSKPVDSHTMNVLYGKQGSGKSTILYRLTAPLKEFTSQANFMQIADDREHGLWSNYVVIIDEMSHAARADIEAVKTKITSPGWQARLMHTNINTHIINKSTFIGTSNKDLSRLITDDTGMRRYFQIDCFDTFDYDAVNAFDYVTLWQSIDENAASPLFAPENAELFARVRELQEEKRSVSIVEQFMAERTYKSTTEQIKAIDLFKEYQEFEEEQGCMHKKSAKQFSNELMDVYKRVYGLHVERKRNNSGNVYLISKQ